MASERTGLSIGRVIDDNMRRKLTAVAKIAKLQEQKKELQAKSRELQEQIVELREELQEELIQEGPYVRGALRSALLWEAKRPTKKQA